MRGVAVALCSACSTPPRLSSRIVGGRCPLHFVLGLQGVLLGPRFTPSACLTWEIPRLLLVAFFFRDRLFVFCVLRGSQTRLPTHLAAGFLLRHWLRHRGQPAAHKSARDRQRDRPAHPQARQLKAVARARGVRGARRGPRHRGAARVRGRGGGGRVLEGHAAVHLDARDAVAAVECERGGLPHGRQYHLRH